MSDIPYLHFHNKLRNELKVTRNELKGIRDELIRSNEKLDNKLDRLDEKMDNARTHWQDYVWQLSKYVRSYERFLLV